MRSELSEHELEEQPEAVLPSPQPEEQSSIVDVIKVFARELVLVFVPALVLALIIHLFLAQATVVYGQSMEPNLHDHQRLIIEKISYRFRPPQRGDIVVVDLPQMSEKLIKRVIGLPGDTLEIKGGLVFINGQQMDEPYIYNLNQQYYGPAVVPADSFFVMGDNRGNSNDSRAFGPVERSMIVGRAWLRYWPISDLTLF